MKGRINLLVWTVVNRKNQEYEQLNQEGYLICDHTHKSCLPNVPDFDDFKLCYDWMAQKLEEHIGNPKHLVYPRWVWYKIDGNTDISTVDKIFYSREPGSYQILVFDIDPSSVLLSDYDAWHICLNRGYFAITEEEDSQWDEYILSLGIKDSPYIWDSEYFDSLSDDKKLSVFQARDKIIKSWDLIFDIDNESEYAFYSNNEKTIQGVTWILQKKDLVSVHDFVITQEDVDAYYQALDE